MIKARPTPAASAGQTSGTVTRSSRRPRPAPSEAAGPERFSGKVVIDATNPLDFSQGFPPSLGWANTDSGGEHVQRAIPDAKVVKAFNTIGNAYFVEPHFTEGAPTMLVAGDDEEAKILIGKAIVDFGWPAPVDVGGIEYMIDDRDGRPLYYDVNALSNFVADAVNVVGFDPFARLVDYLERRAGGVSPLVV